MPWPASSADLWRFAVGSPTRVPSPRCNLCRLAFPDDALELLRPWLGPTVPALLATACLPFVVGPAPAELSAA